MSDVGQNAGRSFSFAELAQDQAKKFAGGDSRNLLAGEPTTLPPGNAGPFVGEQSGSSLETTGLPGGIPNSFVPPGNGEMGAAAPLQPDSSGEVGGDLGGALEMLEKLIPSEPTDESNADGGEVFYEPPVPLEQMSSNEQNAYKEMQRAFTKKTTELAEKKKEADALRSEYEKKLATFGSNSDSNQAGLSLQQIQQAFSQPIQSAQPLGGSQDDWDAISRATGVQIDDMTSDETKQLARAMYVNRIADERRNQQAVSQQRAMNALQGEFNRFADSKGINGGKRDQVATLMYSVLPYIPNATMEGAFEFVQGAMGVNANQTGDDFIASVKESPHYAKVQREVLRDLKEKARSNVPSPLSSVPSGSGSGPDMTQGLAPVAPGVRQVPSFKDAAVEAMKRFTQRFGRK